MDFLQREIILLSSYKWNSIVDWWESLNMKSEVPLSEQHFSRRFFWRFCLKTTLQVFWFGQNWAWQGGLHVFGMGIGSRVKIAGALSLRKIATVVRVPYLEHPQTFIKSPFPNFWEKVRQTPKRLYPFSGYPIFSGENWEVTKYRRESILPESSFCSWRGELS